MRGTLTHVRVGALRLLLVGCVIFASERTAAATFVVSSSGDAPDSAPGDGTCTAASGACTLRAAIEEANAAPDEDVVKFFLKAGDTTISPNAQLPVVTAPLTIDGQSQPGFAGSPVVELDGRGVIETGLEVRGTEEVRASVRLHALAVNRFVERGLWFREWHSSEVIGCFIGLAVDGKTAAGNGVGIETRGVGSLVVGGLEPQKRNVISGNDTFGILAHGVVCDFPGECTDDIQCAWVAVVGNHIGTNAEGAAAVPNKTGVQVTECGARIGGPTHGQGNVISGNSDVGVKMGDRLGGFDGPLALGVVQGNTIGLDATGTTPVPNGVGADSEGALVGGTEPGEGNLISGNRGAGVVCGFGSLGCNVRGNVVGLNAEGSAAGNGGNGITGQVPAIVEHNVIAANAQHGLALRGWNSIDMDSDHSIVANFVGTNQTGKPGLGNRGDGVHAVDVRSGFPTRVGGTDEGEANVIAFNGGAGISVARHDGVWSTRNRIFMNGGLGIDRGWPGPTPNARCDEPSYFPFIPVISRAQIVGSELVVEGTAPEGSIVDVFEARADPTGFGEGERFVFSAVEGSDDDGDDSYGASVHPAAGVVGHAARFRFRGTVPKCGTLTALASVFGDPESGTWEFSPVVEIDGLPPCEAEPGEPGWSRDESLLCTSEAASTVSAYPTGGCTIGPLPPRRSRIPAAAGGVALILVALRRQRSRRRGALVTHRYSFGASGGHGTGSGAGGLQGTFWGHSTS